MTKIYSVPLCGFYKKKPRIYGPVVKQNTDRKRERKKNDGMNIL